MKQLPPDWNCRVSDHLYAKGGAGSDKARIDVGQKRYELSGSSRLMDGDLQIRAQRMTLSDDALTGRGRSHVGSRTTAGPAIQFKAARIEVDLQII